MIFKITENNKSNKILIKALLNVVRIFSSATTKLNLLETSSLILSVILIKFLVVV